MYTTPSKRLSGTWLYQLNITQSYIHVHVAAAINKRYKSLTICWLDLMHISGSVHHKLISFSLHHYHSSNHFINLHVVSNFYTDLFASVSTKTWSTATIPPRIEDTVKLHLATHGYYFSDTEQTLSLLQ